MVQFMAFMASVLGFICNYLLYVFGLVFKLICRSLENYCKKDYGSRYLDMEDFREEEDGVWLEKSESGNKGNGESENSMSAMAATSASKYEFMIGKGISGFVEQPKSMSLSVQELYLGSKDYTVCNNTENKDIVKVNLEEEVVGLDKTEDSVESFGVAMVLEKAEQKMFTEHVVSEKGDIDGLEIISLCKEDSVDEVESVSEDCSLRFGSEPESISSSGELSMNKYIVDSIAYEFFAYRNVDKALEPVGLLANVAEKVVEDIEEENEIIEEESEIIEEESEIVEEISSCEISLSDPEETDADDDSNDSDEEYIEFEPHFKNLSSLEAKILSGEVVNKHEEEDLVQDEKEPENNLEKIEGTNLGEKPSKSNSDDQNDLDYMWEHEDVIEQLKLELRNARTGGLPTILEEEEPESPTIVEGLKPLKIDVKFEFKDRMEEIQKVYKSYAEKMRKLDMLNSQTMHAIGFLQLKDPVKSNSMLNSSASAAKSLPHNIWLRKQRRVTADPMQKFTGELQSNLELVYVGHVCLSWEILHWQYGKVQELQNSNSQGFQRYNQVAGEFQLFQVLMHRFMENEPFQGPRVQNYVNNRCVLRNLLQIPAIRDDCFKEKKVRRDEEEDAISSSMLAKIIEDSLRVFWEFVRADKDEKNVILNSPHQNHINLQHAADLEVLMNTRSDLQKKEKKLKDILRSGNCIVKRFQKHQNNDQLDHLQLVAQVELKLVSRVLNMSRLTRDQLAWCHGKLDQINIVNRKIHMEPTFLLFPC
ncbi:uncharacterized protein LOC126718798 [Quercus robur]|uniref:uncharacterized protein LOC126718798 n=1 Tax=Quercus robur TaxID=38942 RepID=UPI00216112E3|nr:uncharacterized protein LOC126718798 [Quercus robur]